MDAYEQINKMNEMSLVYSTEDWIQHEDRDIIRKTHYLKMHIKKMPQNKRMKII